MDLAALGAEDGGDTDASGWRSAATGRALNRGAVKQLLPLATGAGGDAPGGDVDEEDITPGRKHGREQREVEAMMDLTPTSDSSDVEARFTAMRDGFVYEAPKSALDASNVIPKNIAPVVTQIVDDSNDGPMFRKEAVPAVPAQRKHSLLTQEMLNSDHHHRRSRSEPIRQLDAFSVGSLSDGSSCESTPSDCDAQGTAAAGGAPFLRSAHRSQSIKYETQMLASSVVGELVRALVKLCMSSPEMPDLPAPEPRSYEVRMLDDDTNEPDMDFPALDWKAPLSGVGISRLALCITDSAKALLLLHATDAKSSTGRGVIKISFTPAVLVNLEEEALKAPRSSERRRRRRSSGGRERAWTSPDAPVGGASTHEPGPAFEAPAGSDSAKTWHTTQVLGETTVVDVIRQLCRLCEGLSGMTDLLRKDAAEYEIRMMDDDEPDTDFPEIDRRMPILETGEDVLALCDKEEGSRMELLLKLTRTKAATGRTVARLQFRRVRAAAPEAVALPPAHHQRGAVETPTRERSTSKSSGDPLGLDLTAAVAGAGDEGGVMMEQPQTRVTLGTTQMPQDTTVGAMIQCLINLSHEAPAPGVQPLSREPGKYCLRIIDEDEGMPDFDFPLLDSRSIILALGEEKLAFCNTADASPSGVILELKVSKSSSSVGRPILVAELTIAASVPAETDPASPTRGGDDEIDDLEYRRRSRELSRLFAPDDIPDDLEDLAAFDAAVAIAESLSSPPEHVPIYTTTTSPSSSRPPIGPPNPRTLDSSRSQVPAPPVALPHQHSFNSVGTDDSGSVDSGGAESPVESASEDELSTTSSSRSLPQVD